jgi:adenosylcobinamide-phosphate synthase
MVALKLLMAYLIDRVVGDPRWLPHPVVLMGKVISLLEKGIRKVCKNDGSLKAAGLLFPVLLVGGSFAVVWGILKGLSLIHPYLAIAVEVWLISTTIAVKGLESAGKEIYGLLKKGNIQEARKSLSMVVGRDTKHLDEKEVSRGAVETVAENIVDAIISPLFYAGIGGAPLAMAYRAANTLDSMVGYKNEKYLHLGWASARFDDIANFIPARITAGLLVVICWVLRLDWKGAYLSIRRDARKHPSPNSGFTEAGVAGALGIQLGGLNYYQGIPSHRATMGIPTRVLVAEDIVKTNQIMNGVTLLFLLVVAIIEYLI